MMSDLKSAARTAAEQPAAAQRTRWCVISVAVGLICLLTNTVFAASSDPDIVRIEEDWIVEVTEPDAEESSPQIITSMSSTNELGDVHALFELNHRTLPDYYAGGMEIQLWSHDELIDLRVSPRTAKLSFPNESIYYTMRMEIDDGLVKFSARNGHSETWGEFGSWGWLEVDTTTTQSKLNSYDPQESVVNSRVGFAKHRVNRFGILRVRYYTHDNVLVKTDYTDRWVHVLDDTP